MKGAAHAAQPEDQQLTNATNLTLIGVFLGLLAAFTARQASRGEDVQIKPFDLLLLGLSPYRAGHLIAYERVTERSYGTVRLRR